MHKIQYKFTKRINKCDVTIKSTIIKRTISGKKLVEIIKKSTKERQNVCVCVCVCVRERERERERERLTFFVVDNLEEIVERGGNEVRRNLYEN